MLRTKGLAYAAIGALLGLFLSRPAASDQTATCMMDDKDHLAKYSCPDGYEVVYTGEGTKVCNGSCFRKGNSQSLQLAIGNLIGTRFGHDYLPATMEMSAAADELLRTGKASIAIPHKGSLEFKVPRTQR
jgi:hypothetical protein